MTKQLFTINEAAKLLGVSIKTLRRWDQKGLLLAQRTIGNQRRYDLEDLEKLKGKKVKSTLKKKQAAIARQVSIAEAALFLGISVKTLRRWEAKGIIASHRSPTNQRYFLTSDLSSLKNAKTEPEVFKPTSVEEAKINPIPTSQPIFNPTHPFAQPQIQFSKTLFTLIGLIIAVAAFGGSLALSQIGLPATKILSFLPKVMTHDKKPGSGDEVLATETKRHDYAFKVSVPAEFMKTASVAGKLTAPNIVYSVIAGDNVTVSGDPQNPTISTDITLTGGDGITVVGDTITNADPGSAQKIFGNIKVGSTTLSAGSNTDTFELAAGSNITLATDTSNKKITISGPDSSGIEGVEVSESGTTVVNSATGFDFLGGDFDISESPPGTAAIQLASTLTSVTGVAGSFAVGSSSTIGTTLDVGTNLHVTGNTDLDGNFTLGSDTINDLTGVGIDVSGNALSVRLATLGGAGSTSSNSGLEVDTNGLSLLKGCADSEILKWDDTNALWQCATDSGGSGGGGVTTIQTNDVNIGTSVDTLDFSTLFSLTASPANEINITIAGDSIGDTQLAFDTGQNLTTVSSPTFSGLTVASLTRGGDTITDFTGTGLQMNVNSLETTLGTSVDLASAEVTGILPLANGGTGLNINSATIADGQILIGNDGANGFSLANLTAGSGISITNGSGAITISQSGSGASKWTQSDSLGVLYPNISTLDMLVGGTSSSSAKFAVLNVAGGTPTASVSAGANGGLFVTANGSIETTTRQTLTVGGGNTGNIVIDAGSNLITLSDPTTFSSTIRLGSDTISDFTGTGLQMNSGSLETTLGTSVDLASAEVTGILPLANGGTGLNINSTTIADGQLLIGNDGANGFTLANLTAGTGISITNGSGSITIAQTGSGSSKWTQSDSLGILYPNISTLDLLIGGTTSSSAKFAFLNNAGGTPVASIAGNLTLDSTGSIQSTKNQNLTFGGDSTGNIILSPRNGSGDVRINGTTTLNGITYTWPGSQTSGYVLQTDGSGVLSWIAPGTLPTSDDWDTLNGILTPKIETQDLLLGAQSTTSAKFAFINVNSGIPTASISAITAGNALSLDANGTIGTTTKQTLTLGTTSTGNIALGTDATARTVTIGNSTGASAVNVNSGTGNINLTASTGNIYFDDVRTAAIPFSISATDLNTPTKGIIDAINEAYDAGVGGGSGVWSTNSNAIYPTALQRRVGVGTTTASEIASSFYVTRSLSSGALGKALAIFNQTENQDIFAASASGVTKFVLTNAGNASASAGFTINGSGALQTTNKETLTLGSSSTGNIMIGNTGFTSCSALETVNGVLTCGADDVGSAGTNYLQMINGAISPFSETLDLLVGSTATSSAEFAVTGIAQGTPTATLSATTNGNGLSLNASTGTIQSLNNNSLILGGSSTGNIVLSDAAIFSSTLQLGTDTISDFTGTGLTMNGTSLETTLGTSVDLASEVTGILPVANGGTGLNINSTTIADGQLLIGNDGANGFSLATLTAGTGISISNGSGTITISQTGSGSSKWTQSDSLGILYPNISTLDLLIGGTTSSSAKFAFINNTGGGTPTASIAGTGNNALSLDGNGTIATANEQTLTLGSTATGDVNLVIGGSNKLRINGIAGANVGAATCVVTSNGIVTGTGSCDTPLSSFIWSTIPGAIVEGNTTQDLLIGGLATASAKFAVINVNSGTPTASLSAGLAGGAYLTAAGLLQSTAFQSLTVGGDTTGNISISPRNGSGLLGLNVGSLTINGSTGVTTGSPTCVSVTNGIVTGTGGCGAGAGGSVWTLNTTNGTLYPINNTLDLLIGGVSTASAKFAVLNVAGGTPTASVAGTTGSSLLTADGTLQTSNRQTLNVGGGNTGNIVIDAGSDLITLSDPTTFASTLRLGSDTIADFTGTGLIMNGTSLETTLGLSVDLTSEVNGILPIASGGSPFEQNLGAIFERITTQDFLLGSTATNSAKFAVTNIAAGTPIATLSATTNGNGLSLTASTGTIQSLNNNSLILGGSSTGNIVLSDAAIFSSTLQLGTDTISDFTGTGLIMNGTSLETTLGLSVDLTSEVNGILPIASGGSPFEQSQGAIIERITTQDFLLGATSTGSARFAVLNIAGGTPTASLSAGIAGGAFLSADGTLQTTSYQSLNIGNGNTGNISLSAKGGTGLLSLSTGSLTMNGSAGVTAASPTCVSVTNGIVTGTGGCGAGAGGSVWTLNTTSGTLYPINNTVDLLIGGVSSDSARFHVFGSAALAGTTPVASISGNTSNAGLIADNRIGDLFAASSSGLNRFVIRNNGNVGIGTALPTSQLQIMNLPASTTNSLAMYISSTGNARIDSNGTATLFLNFATGNTISLGGASAVGGTDTNLQVYGATDFRRNTESANALRVFGSTGAGSPVLFNISSMLTGPTASVSAVTTGAGLVVDNRGTGDLFTASSSGLERFTIHQNGTIMLSTVPYNNCTALEAVNGLLTCGVDDSSVGGSTNWTLDTVNGVLRPNNNSVDFLLGGTSSSSAKFHVYGAAPLQGTQPVASVSANTSNAGLIVDNRIGDLFTASSSGLPRFVIKQDSTIQAYGFGYQSNGFGSQSRVQLSRANGTQAAPTIVAADDIAGQFVTTAFDGTNYISVADMLTAVDGTPGTSDMPGRLMFRTVKDGQAGLTERMRITNAGYVGIGTGTPLAILDVRGESSNPTNNNTMPVASFSAKSTFASMVVDNSGSGDLFTASSSGLNRFVIAQNGNVGIGTTIPDELLHLQKDADTYLKIHATTGTGQIAGLKLQRGNAADNLTDWNIYDQTGALFFDSSTNATTRNRLYIDDQTGYLGINTSTPLATLDVRRTVGTTPTASLSGRTSFAGLVVDNSGAGDIFTASSSGLNRFVIKQNGNVGIGTALPTAPFEVFKTGTNDPIAKFGSTGTSDAQAVSVENGSGSLSSFVSGGPNNFITGSIIGDTGLRISTGDRFLIGNSSTVQFAIDANGKIGIGTSTPIATLDLKAATNSFSIASISGATNLGFAGLVVDNSGSGNIFTASSSGLERFTIRQNGTIMLSTVPYNNCTALETINGLLTCGVDDTSGGGSNWTLDTTLGVLRPNNNSVDLLLGGTSSSSAKFHVYGAAPLQGTQPVASVSGNTSNTGLIVDNRIGDLFAASSSGLNRFVIRNNGQIGIGTAVPSANRDLEIASSNMSTYMKFNPTTSEDWTVGADGFGLSFINDTDGATRMTLDENGNVGIGATDPTLGTFSRGLEIADSGTGPALALNATSGKKFIIGSADSPAGLYFRDDTAGAYRMVIDTNGKLGINTGTSNVLGTMDLRGNTAHQPIASLSGNTSFAGLIVDNRTGDLFTASSSGLTRFTIANNGSVTLRASTSALLTIENTQGADVMTVDSLYNKMDLLASATGALGAAAWSSTSTLAGVHDGSTVVTANGFLYNIGGANAGTYTNAADVEYARINTDGTVGTWKTTTSLPDSGRSEHSTVVANGYVYVIGGTNSASKSTVYYARLNPDGTIGAWNSTTALPNVLIEHSSVVVGNYLYVFGGYNATAVDWQTAVYYARLNGDGTIGSWSTATQSLPQKRSNMTAVTANGFIYLLGGKDGTALPGGTKNTIYYARTNPDGNITNGWITTTLPVSRQLGSSVISNGNIYYIGGKDNTDAVISDIFYAPLNSDGSIGTWTTSTQLPQPRQNHASAIVNGYIYVVGGGDTVNFSSNTTYYISTARVRIGGNLDLIGLQGQSIASSAGDFSLGTTGGSLTAGNGMFVGGLQVIGQTMLSSNLNVNGAFNAFEGALILSSNTTAPVASISGSTSSTGLIVDNSGSGPIFDARTNTVSRLYVAQNGNVGIGTTAPENHFNVADTLDGVTSGVANVSLIVRNLAATDGQGTAIGFANSNTTTNLGAKIVFVRTGSNSLGDLAFYTKPNTTSGDTTTEKLRITSGGMVGINTTSPLGTLDVRGNPVNGGTIPIASFSAKTSFAGLVVDNSDNGDIFTASSSGLTRFVIKQNGNVGIGTTMPSANLQVVQTSTQEGLRINSSNANLLSAFSAYDPNGILGLAYNGSFRSTTVLGGVAGFDTPALGVRSDAGDAISLRVGHLSGTPLFSTAATASISARTSFATLVVDNNLGDIFTASSSGLSRFVINNNGNVGIGTALPTSKLHIVENNLGGTTLLTLRDEQRISTIEMFASANDTPIIRSGTNDSLNFAANNGNSNPSITIANTDLVGIHTTSPLASLDIRTRIDTLAVASVSGKSNSFAAMVVDNSGRGDIFTASSSGLTRFTIQQNGNIAIGTQSANYNFELAGKNAAFNSGQDGSLSNWSISGNNMLVNVASASAVAANGYLYQIGGRDTSGLRQNSRAVTFSRIRADGSLDPFASTSALPQGRVAHASVALNGYLYTIGGDSLGTTPNTVFYSKMNSNGTLAPWNQTSNLATNNASASAVVNPATNTIYVGGGRSGVVQRATQNPDGTLSSWTNQTILNGNSVGAENPLMVLANGFVYFVGGKTNAGPSTAVWAAKINTDGSLNTAISTTPLPTALSYVSGGLINGYLYVVGGEATGNAPVATVYYSKVAANGTLTGGWQTGGSIPVTKAGAASAIYNGYMYILGGKMSTTANSFSASIFYASGARVLMAASLDLIGLTGTGTSLASGSAGLGGSIFAGRIFSNDNLEVVGNTNLWGGLSVNNGIIADTLSLSGGLGTTPSASISANSSFATMVVNNSGRGDLFTASASGLTRFVISNAGYVGIGTPNPEFALHIARATAVTEQAIYFQTTTGVDWKMYQPAAGNSLNFWNDNGAADVLTLESRIGTVGIGTTNPIATLDLRARTANFPVASISGSTNRGFASLVVDNSGSGDLFTASSSGNTRFFIRNNGNVGIPDNGRPAGEQLLLIGDDGFFTDIDSTHTIGLYGFTDSTQAGLKLGSGGGTVYGKVAGNGAATPSIGIGTTSPQAALHVAGTIWATGDNTGLAAAAGTGTGTGYAGGHGYIFAYDYGTSTAQNLNINEPGGHVLIATGTDCGRTLCVGSPCTNSGTNSCVDYAEYYDASEIVSPAEIVSLDPASSSGKLVRIADRRYDPDAMGIAATNPAFVIEEGSTGIGGSTGPVNPSRKPPVALAGRVPVKVSTINGALTIGNYVTSSDIKGHGMKATQAGTTVGKVMQDFDPANGKVGEGLIECPAGTPEGVVCGQIFVYANTSWHDPDLYLTSTGNIELFEKAGAPSLEAASTYGVNMPDGSEVIRTGVFSDAVIGNLRTGSLDVQNLSLGGTNLTDKLIGLEGNFASASAGFAAPLATLQTQVLSLQDRVASLEAKIDLLNASNSAFFNPNFENFTASTGAELSIDKLDVNGAITAGSLSVLGYTTMNELSVTGTIRTGVLTIKGQSNGGASISTLNGDLRLQEQGFGGIDILNGKMTIDTSGNVQTVGEITAKKFNVDTTDTLSASVGQGTIPLNGTNAIIYTTAVTTDSHIFITPRTKTNQQVSVTTQTSGTSFKVEITSPAPQPIKFDWFIIN